MKKLLSLLIYLTLIFSSCKKEDDSPNSGSTNNTPASIIGSWDLTEYHDINTEGYYLGGYPNGTKIITNSADVIMLPGDTFWNLQTLNWTFSTDGYMTETFNDTGIYNMSYEKSENILTIDTNHIWSIITLSSSKLIINSESIDTSTSYWDPNNDTTYFSENSTTIKLDRSSFTTDDTTSKRIQKLEELLF